jgi:hypothetical protein
MSNLATWKILEDMTLKLRRKGIETPANIINDLRSAKSMLEISTEKDSGEFLGKIQECLDNVQAYLTGQIEKTFGAQAADDFLRQLEEATTQTCQSCQPKQANHKDTFIYGVPRDQKWIRVEPIEGLSAEKLTQIACQKNLSIKPQQDGKLVVYGTPKDLKDFVKEMTIQQPKK